MAINPNTNATMTGRITAPDANYPYGSAKDETSVGAGDGTPYFKQRADDVFGFFQSLLRLSSIVPTGNAETAVASQYLQSIVELASGRAFLYDDVGAADAYVLNVRTNQQGVASYFNGMEVKFDAAVINTGGAVTINVAGLGVKDVTDNNGDDPLEGIISEKTTLIFNTADDRFEIGTVKTQQLAKISASVAANALTLNIEPQRIDFRSATLSDGTVEAIDILSQIPLVVPSGATLGSVDTEQSRLILIALNNAGTVELAVVNENCSIDLDESGLISTTAIDATADSATVIYSAVARTNLPYRVVGFIEITEAVAGTWATAPSLVQGGGGEALREIDTRVLKDVSASRAQGVEYTNNTGRGIIVYVGALPSTSTNSLEFFLNGVEILHWNNGDAHTQAVGFTVYVPYLSTYQVDSDKSSFRSWLELR